MVLATWWYEDGAPVVAPRAGVSVELAGDDAELASAADLPPGEVARRRAEGHRAYIARVGDELAAYGWVATRRASIGELGLSFELPVGQRYLWDFATLPAFRGRGVYPHLLAEIVGRECPPATRLWIIHAPENVPSGIGIARAGFAPVAELSLDRDGRPALALIGEWERADAAMRLFGLPLVTSPLDPCWGCGGCACGHHDPGGDGCACAIKPAR